MAWWFGYRSPREHPRISPEELAHIEAGQDRSAESADFRRPSWLEIARQRKFWAIALPRFLADPAKTVPGTSMGYASIADKKERADLIAYLKAANETPECANQDRKRGR